jgi:hypothetical protein
MKCPFFNTEAGETFLLFLGTGHSRLEMLPPISGNVNLRKLRKYSETRDYERLPRGVMT